MGKGLFLSLPLAGHTNPSLGLVRELVNRGDEIVYVSTPAFADRVTGSGAEFRAYRNVFLTDLREVPDRLHELSWLLTRTVNEVLEQELEAWRAVKPDYIIADSSAPWGHWVGELLEVPVVTSVSTFAVNRKVLRYAAAHGIRPKHAGQALAKVRCIARSLLLVRKLRRQYGVRGPGGTGLVIARSGLNIVYTSRRFQPCGNTFDQRFHFVGPSVAGREEVVDLPLPDSTKPVLYISLGTLFNADATFYRQCFEAFAAMDCHVVLSTGTNVTVESLGKPPANFTVRSHVPQLEVLRRARVFVTHGGMNSVSESLLCGVPMVIVPQMSEQELIARRAEELGACLRLGPATATSSALRAAVERVLDRPKFKTAAEWIRATFESSGGMKAAADAVVAYTR